MFDYVGWLDNWNYNVKGLYTMYMKIHLIDTQLIYLEQFHNLIR